MRYVFDLYVYVQYFHSGYSQVKLLILAKKWDNSWKLGHQLRESSLQAIRFF